MCSKLIDFYIKNHTKNVFNKKDVSQECMKQFSFTAEEFNRSDTIHTFFLTDNNNKKIYNETSYDLVLLIFTCCNVFLINNFIFFTFTNTYSEICNAFLFSLHMYSIRFTHSKRYKNKHSSMRENEMNPFILIQKITFRNSARTQKRDKKKKTWRKVEHGAKQVTF